MMTAIKDISSTDATVAAKPIRVLLAAGGTGGHVYPAISIADAVKKIQPEAEILFVGTKDRMEWVTVPKSRYKIRSVWISGFHRRLTPQNLLFPVKLVTSLFQSLFILLRFRPDAVVSCGGFAAGPVGWVASKLGIPVVIQEQNSYPGVTNRMLAGNAHTIFTAFDVAKEHLPESKVKLAGNPVRSALKPIDKATAAPEFDFDPAIPVILVLGGSGGAKAINHILERELRTFHNEMEIQVIWQCGQKYYPELAQRIANDRYPNLRLLDYIGNMNMAYAAADIVISRAGASTCSELMAVGKPSILVPSPNVAGDHQTKNAAALADHGAAMLMPEEQLIEKLVPTVKELLENPDALEQMGKKAAELSKPDAARTIARTIFEIAEERRNA